MKERLISAVVALVFAGMAAMFGVGASVIHDDYLHERDYKSWIESPGKLRKLELQQLLHRMRWQYVVSCEYEFDFAGTSHVARRYDLKGEVYQTHKEAKAAVEATLGITGRAQWLKIQRGSFDEWALDARDIAVRVRHSPRDPTATTLTETPPMAGWLNWGLILVLALLALVTGLGSLVMAFVTLRGSDAD